MHLRVAQSPNVRERAEEGILPRRSVALRWPHSTSLRAGVRREEESLFFAHPPFATPSRQKRARWGPRLKRPGYYQPSLPGLTRAAPGS